MFGKNNFGKAALGKTMLFSGAAIVPNLTPHFTRLTIRQPRMVRRSIRILS